MTADAGEVWLADIGGERRGEVLVLSSTRTNRLVGRAVVAPFVAPPPIATLPRWLIPTGDRVAAVDQVATVAVARLLELRSRPPYAVLLRARAALSALTS